MIDTFVTSIKDLWMGSGFMNLDWRQLVMIGVSCLLIYLAIVKQFEPLLLLPIAFGMLLANIPLAGLSSYSEGGLLYWLYRGVKLGIYPPLIFLGIGTMTDFGPLIANPKSFLLGAAAQGGIFFTFIGAMVLGFTPQEAGSIAIIGGADGPTAIYTAKTLLAGGNEQMIGSIAVAAYSYMALVPLIQPPIMKALTTKKERAVVMGQLRPVSKTEKIIFPIIVTLLVSFLVPDAAPLVGMLMLGNLMRESGVVDRLVKTAQNELMNIITIFLGVTVGATTTYDVFLTWDTIKIVVLGLVAFCLGTACGVLFGKLMYLATGGKVNPLIGRCICGS